MMSGWDGMGWGLGLGAVKKEKASGLWSTRAPAAAEYATATKELEFCDRERAGQGGAGGGGDGSDDSIER